MMTNQPSTQESARQRESASERAPTTTHYLAGFHRPAEVQRILGDPRKSVGLPVSNELAAASFIGRK